MPQGRVLDRAIDRIAFSSDASFYQLVPRAVIQPANLEEIRNLFRLSRGSKIPLVFRAGGTSLSGQSITDGLLVDISRFWGLAQVEAEGRRVRVQPGAIGQSVNNLLKPFGAKIGPDPASISVARLGGILSNNASGMCCGVAQNAFHTLRSMKFMLPSGTVVDTALPNADSRFQSAEPELCSRLMQLKVRIEKNEALVTKIRSKYRIKNTTGYSLNAFLDFNTPAQIFSHLLIGAEGTLGFIAEAVLETVPDLPQKFTGLLLFKSLHTACEAIEPLSNAGAATLELLDRSSLRAVDGKVGMPFRDSDLPDDASALLVEFQAGTEAADQENRASAARAVRGIDLLAAPKLTGEPVEQASLWSLRKGLFPSVGAVRARGTSVIIEDVAFPIARLGAAASALRGLFAKHGYDEAILFGHAKDGNLHFVITQGFETRKQILQYRSFIEEMVDLVVGRFDGSLKAEHGTGRNMAPFVEAEWGPEALGIMRELKTVVDPENLINPGVIINDDPDAHICALKAMPQVEEEVDKCIECGYCEPKCPSRDLTLTPRQRIVVRRAFERLAAGAADPEISAALEQDFPYMAIDTCAVDGLCAVSCPVNIDTGSLVKRFRKEAHSRISQRAAWFAASHFEVVEEAARAALWAGHVIDRALGPKAMVAVTEVMDFLTQQIMRKRFWKWSREMPLPRHGRLPRQVIDNADAVYFPACISRIFGPAKGDRFDIGATQAMLRLAARAGIRLLVPDDVKGNCCGVPFSSKGFDSAYQLSVNRTVESLFRWSQGGVLPIVIDTSPCTYGLKTCRPALTPQNQRKWDRLTILDSIDYVASHILPALQIERRVSAIALHPVCSVIKMGIVEKLAQVVRSCTNEVLLPDEAACCGFAGDRGFLLPELTASACASSATRVKQRHFDAHCSSSRTCEIAMTRATGETYTSYLNVVEWATRPSDSIA